MFQNLPVLNELKILLIFSVWFLCILFYPRSVLANDACVVSNDNLVSHWSFDVISGNTVEDGVGSNDGQMINGPVSVPGVKGSGLSFDGVDDEVRVPASEDLNITGDVTVSLWAKLLTSSKDIDILLVKGGGTLNGVDAATSYVINFLKNSSNDYKSIVAGFEYDNGDNENIFGKIIKENAFHYYTYVRDGFSQKIYVDGSLNSISTFSDIPGNTSNLDLTIGSLNNDDPPGSLYNFHGVMDEVKIYDRALSDCEVEAAFAAGSQSSLVSWWSFDNVDGVSVPDLVDGNDGVLLNGPMIVSGQVGSGVSFDGVDDEMRVAAADNLNITGDVTVEMWVKRESFDLNYQHLLSKGGGSFSGDAPSAYLLAFTRLPVENSEDRIYVGFENLVGNDEIVYGRSVEDTLFHHYVYTRDNESHRLYFNGELENESDYINFPGDTSGLDLVIGAQNNESSSINHFNGVIDEVKIYNRALNLVEVQDAYESGLGEEEEEEDDVLDVMFFSQRDDQWNFVLDEPVEYDFASSWAAPGKTKVENWGCALTSAAMVLDYHGVTQGVVLDGTDVMGYIPTNPKSLNSWLINNKGYTSGGKVIWSSITKYAKEASDYALSGSGKTFEFKYPIYTGISQVGGDINNEIPGILRLVNNSNGGTHFVVTTGVDGTNDILVNDPWQLPEVDPPHSLNALYPSGDYTRSKLGRFVPSETDLSYLWMFGEPGVQIEVVDPVSGLADAESFGFVESILNGVDSEAKGSPSEYVWGLPKPEGGRYMVRLMVNPGDEGLKSVDVRLFDENGNQYQLLITRFLKSGEIDEILLELGDDLSSVEMISNYSYDRLVHDIRAAGKLEMIKLKGLVRVWVGQTKLAEWFDNRGRDRLAKLTLKRMKKMIERATPKFVDEEASELLVWQIEELVEKL